MRSLYLLFPLLLVSGALAWCQGLFADNPRIESCVNLLLSDKRNGEKISALDDLLTIDTPESMDGLLTYLTTPGQDPRMKQKVLLALGRHGSADAVAVIDKFEAWAENRRSQPPALKCKVWMNGETPDFIATAQDGTQWATFQMVCTAGKPAKMVKPQWWITNSKDGAEWSAPTFLGAMEDPEQFLTAVAMKKSVLDPYLVDNDGDGLPNQFEQYLGTDADKADTDGDGRSDREDGCPFTPAAPRDAAADIRQAVFTYSFATDDLPTVISCVQDAHLVGSNRMVDAAAQEYRGQPGWVLPAARAVLFAERRFGMAILKQTETAATVRLDLARLGQVFTLEKKHDRWVVVKVNTAWIQ